MKHKIAYEDKNIIAFLISFLAVILLEVISCSVSGIVYFFLPYIGLLGIVCSLFWIIYSLIVVLVKRKKMLLLTLFGSIPLLGSFIVTMIYSFLFSFFNRDYPNYQYVKYTFPGLSELYRFDKPSYDETKILAGKELLFFFPDFICWSVVTFIIIALSLWLWLKRQEKNGEMIG